jgi:hypothetical protein
MKTRENIYSLSVFPHRNYALPAVPSTPSMDEETKLLDQALSDIIHHRKTKLQLSHEGQLISDALGPG